MRPVYYGWFVLAASGVSEMLVQGATSYSAGLFVLPLQAEFHISRAIANSSILILFFGTMLVAPLAGRWLDGQPIRKMMLAGAVLLASSMVAISVSFSLLIIAAILLLPMATAFMMLGPLNTSTLASRWFFRRRGLALGIAAVATSGGGLTVTPLLSRAIEHYGWREALAYEGLILSLIILILALFIVRDRPADKNLTNHPENCGRDLVSSNTPNARLLWTDILLTRSFWIPCLTLAAVSATCQALVITLVPYGVQLGMKPVDAALSISAFAIAAAMTKILAGVLSDRINPRILLVVAALSMALSWTGLSIFAVSDILFASACLAGLALGCAMPTSAGMVAASFGANNFGQVMGWGYALTSALLLVSVLFVGFMYDRFATYQQAFEVFAACLTALLLLVMAMTPGSVKA